MISVAFPTKSFQYVSVNLLQWQKEQDKKCVSNNTVAGSGNVYTSSAILSARYHMSRREPFYGDLMARGTVKRT